MPTALLSVTDKTGLVEFARGLDEMGYVLLSTGGTAKALREAGLTVKDVAEVTGFPEMLDGRIKTLHPKVHGGLLGDIRKEEHVRQMEDAGIDSIGLVCVNLYAFEKTVMSGAGPEEVIESIDIGGPAMVRASAKNHANVFVVVDPGDYDSVLKALDSGEGSEEFRLKLAAKAFRHTAFYDSMVARTLTEAAGEPPMTETYTLGLRRRYTLRYGENPHQPGALFTDPLATGGVARSEQLWGKELSYNNILDADAAWELACDLEPGSCVIVKHGNPCGVATGSSSADNYGTAKAADPVSAFGGIAAFHGPIDKATAEAMTAKNNFLEVVVGTSFTDEAFAVFKERSGWGENVRLLVAEASGKRSDYLVRSINGGAVIHAADEEPETRKWEVVTETKPTPDQERALKLAWAIVAHVKSNAIVLTDSEKLLGVGAGQMNRVQSVRLAIGQAGEAVNGAVLASDAFFPFPDSIETASEAGISCVVQPGGSVKDADVIAKANELGIAMVFTGVRHFRH